MTRTATLFTLALALTLSACGAARAPLEAPAMAPLALPDAPAPAPLTQNVFRGDTSGVVSEEDMRRVLSAPVFLEADARIGVVPVQQRYALDGDVPLATITGQLADALERTGLFEVTSEVTTDWPTDGAIAGLRELATRYRAEYLLLYRHRFVDRSYTNGWGWAWLTLAGGLVVPSHTLETAGVLEATLFDVKTGTLLFTVYERVADEDDVNIWHNDKKRRAMKHTLVTKAAERLTEQVLGKVRRLAAARPAAGGAAVASGR